MKNLAFYLIITITTFLAPIELVCFILMFIMGVDTIVKILSLRTISRKEKRPFRDLYKSRIARKGYFLKVVGYMIMVLPLLPLDVYFLTPFAIKSSATLGYDLGKILTPALFTNGLLVIFCLIELSSINENWFDFSGNNILSGVSKTLKKTKSVVLNASKFYKEVKNDKE
jgi:hypothetical protein